MLRPLRNASSSCTPPLVMSLWSLRATCSAGSSPKRFGSANSRPSSSTAAMRMYFQRAYSSISGALKSALGHQLRDLHFLHLDAHTIGNLQRDKGVAHLGHLAEQSAGRDHLITDRELPDQVLMLLRPLLLRPEQEE